MTENDGPVGQAVRELPFHDSVLQRLHFDWQAGELRLYLLHVGGAQSQLVMTGVFELHLGRRMRWGTSVHINRASVSSGPERGLALEMEMQSGDPIVVKGVTLVEEG